MLFCTECAEQSRAEVTLADRRVRARLTECVDLVTVTYCDRRSSNFHPPQGVTNYPKPDIREFFSDIWAAVKFDAYPMKFGLRAALGVTDELNLMFS